ncbi:MAG: hypothetical protein Unbinned3972contig1001_10 [Prokaryotic dsDNA virus sp.]|nr:MAG: hypothetical protein Unbinned3972contig1001_10 [Prokaryotic dsDNA virus sp.]|tara:strand:- start:34250 stop:35179 length:930 start_codon:yes stop_codon:yes gene_type:complete
MANPNPEKVKGQVASSKRRHMLKRYEPMAMKPGGYDPDKPLPDATIPDLPPTSAQLATQIIPDSDDSTVAAAPWLDPTIEGRLYPAAENKRARIEAARAAIRESEKSGVESATVEAEPVETEPTEDSKTYVSPWRRPGADMDYRPFPDEHPDVTVRDLAEADERQMAELVERYGSLEGVGRAMQAQTKHGHERYLEEMALGGFGNQPWEKGPGIEAYGKSVQDVGDALGWVPNPVPQAVGTGMYSVGAGMQGKWDEVAGGLIGAGLGAAGRHALKQLAKAKDWGGIREKFGPDIAEIMIDQSVQEVGEM